MIRSDLANVEDDLGLSSIDPAIDADLIATTIAHMPPALGFVPVLEAQFERDTGAERSRQLIWRGVIAIVVLNLFLLGDYVALPDVFTLAVELRLGVLTALGIAIVMILRRNPRARIREGMEAAIAVAGAMVIMILAVESESPARIHYPYGILLVVMFATSVQTIRFWYAMAALIGCFLCFVGAVTFIPEATDEQRILAPVLMSGTVLLALTGAYALERETRLAYLNTLLQRLYARRLEELSSHDALTGLGNRRAIDKQFALLRSGQTPARRISAVIVDIDYFKTFNDTYGHLAGDQCLRQVAAALNGEIRNGSDSVFRFGGEEFLALFPDVSAEHAARVAERMRIAVERLGIAHCKPNANSVVTASFGIASGPLEANLKPILVRADQALYDAKRAGRNCVSIAADEQKAEKRAV